MPLEPETITRIKIYAVTAIPVIVSFLIVFILANTIVPIEYLEFLVLGWMLLIVISIGSIFDFVEEKFEAEDSLERYKGYLNWYQAREQSEREQENQSDIEESLTSSNDEEGNSSISSKTQSLRELKQLLDDGAITNEEFKKLKKEILN